MSFFVELPGDKYGNRGYTNSFPCVVEGELVEGEYGTSLTFVAPPEIASCWPSCYFRQETWLEVEGPARPLTWEEREELIEKQGHEKAESFPINHGLLLNVALTCDELSDQELVTLNLTAQLDLLPTGRVFDHQNVKHLFTEKDGTKMHEATKEALAAVVLKRLG